ncbi:hypothetical protein E3Q18_01773 [Wallemia mellicola]|uniref:Methyltransferase type 12 domain-containing protein n=1 Tax=Wallemia mellicola TaxID=1708541 RepID=A0A4V4MM31_9BASI|nr:hypothetical protein E3Q24_00921 [Wallemia mellicola]TIB86650.1 hypothetical protein E3Q21_01605 [Wallemia mellicola]TIB89622.1 hypothetical protein E3Q20_01595 [Wallemia mellicola]TIB92974.1 hypothetical protein E3Q19_01611 [Wallemia mellicola]TIB99022.1 hypothetical protein E3Q18_01773 [Wallemia mellicola]
MSSSSSSEQKLLDKFNKQLKRELYNKNYIDAFNEEEFLEAYLARYVPSRSIIYYRMFKEMNIKDNAKIISIGGGAGSEMAGLQHYLEDNDIKGVKLDILDIGKWDRVIDKLGTTFRESLAVDFYNKDVLSDEIDYTGYNMVTLFFTISELLIQSKKMTFKLLDNLNSCPVGTEFVVIESCALSNVMINNKEYSIKFLLDYNLNKKWQLINYTPSRWFRLEEDYKYPIKLENSRCFICIYKKISP